MTPQRTTAAERPEPDPDVPVEPVDETCAEDADGAATVGAALPIDPEKYGCASASVAVMRRRGSVSSILRRRWCSGWSVWMRDSSSATRSFDGVRPALASQNRYLAHKGQRKV